MLCIYFHIAIHFAPFSFVCLQEKRYICNQIIELHTFVHGHIHKPFRLPDWSLHGFLCHLRHTHPRVAQGAQPLPDSAGLHPDRVGGMEPQFVFLLQKLN